MTKRRRARKGRDPGSGRFQRLVWPKLFADLLGKVSDLALARMTGYSLGAIRAERIRRGIPPFWSFRRIRWSPARLEMLGRMPDAAVAQRIGTTPTTISIKRRSLGIRAFDDTFPKRVSDVWTPKAVALLGKLVDREVARRLGVLPSAVRHARKVRGIPPLVPARRRVVWTKARLSLIGKLSNAAVARRLGISLATVKRRRALLERAPQS